MTEHLIAGPGILDRSTGFGIKFPTGFLRFKRQINLKPWPPTSLVDAADYGVSPTSDDNADAFERAWAAATAH